MRNLTAIICLTVALLFGCTGVCKSADYQNGVTAYQSGDFATALREWTPLAEQGNVGAQYLLGVMSRKGLGVPQDNMTAVKWYTLAAEQGDTDAQYNLGLMYANGHGVPQDYKTAVKWNTLAGTRLKAAPSVRRVPFDHNSIVYGRSSHRWTQLGPAAFRGVA
jgi:hypothetical protein